MLLVMISNEIPINNNQSMLPGNSLPSFDRAISTPVPAKLPAKIEPIEINIKSTRSRASLHILCPPVCMGFKGNLKLI